MTRAPDHRSQRAREKLIAALRDQGQRLTRRQICTLLHLTYNNRNHRHILHLHQEGLVHICGWQQKSGAQPAAIFAWGGRKDAPRPPLKTRLDISRESQRRRVEKVGDEAWRAVRRAYKSGADALIVAGRQVWRKGEGINLAAARVAFGGAER